MENYADNHYLILIDGVVLGCGGFNLSEDGEIAKLSWDIIHPDYHGKGLGTNLTTFRINKISQIEGIRMLSVRTSQLTFKFYEKFGLVLRETIKDYWDVGFDMYRLDCRIEDIQLI